MTSIYDGKQYWLTPPALMKQLDDEFHFDFDPTPYPKPDGWDALKMEWGKVNHLNPPFRKHDGGGYGPTAFVRKAIEEHKKGKTVVLTIPVQSYVNLLMEAGAEYRSLGRVRWLETSTKEPMPGPSPTGCFILRGGCMTTPIEAQLENILFKDTEGGKLPLYPEDGDLPEILAKLTDLLNRERLEAQMKELKRCAQLNLSPEDYGKRLDALKRKFGGQNERN